MVCYSIPSEWQIKYSDIKKVINHMIRMTIWIPEWNSDGTIQIADNLLSIEYQNSPVFESPLCMFCINNVTF